jgi:hypothetical protein
MQWLVSDDPVRARKGHGAFDDVFGTQSAIGSQYLDALVVRSPGTRSAVLRHSQRWRSSSSPIRRRQLRSPALLWFVKTASALFSVNSFFRSPEKRFRLSPFLGFLRVHPFLPTIGYSKSEGTKKRKKG